MIYMRGQAADYDHWRQLGLHRLGLGRRAAVSSSSTRIISSATASITRRRRMADRASARALGHARRLPRRGRADRHPSDRRFQHRRQRRLLLLPRQPEARPALVGGARLSQAGAAPAEPAARDRLPGRARRVRRQARGRRALPAERRVKRRALPRRGDPVGRLDRLAADPAALRRRPGRAACSSSAFRSCSTSPASARTCRTICSCG